MDGLTLLVEARSAGLVVFVSGDKLVVQGPRRAEPIARKLLAHKSEVMAALTIARPSARAAVDTAGAADLIELYNERAAIRQYDGHWPRDLAEHLAYAECIEEWCRCHPLPHDPAVCAGCGRPLGSEVFALADGARVHWERDREFRCLIAHSVARKRRAVEALVTTMGLLPPLGGGLNPLKGWDNQLPLWETHLDGTA